MWARLPDAMKASLQNEIDAGNAVSGASLGWPSPRKGALVTLREPFMCEHTGHTGYYEDTSPHHRSWVGRTYVFSGAYLLASPY